MQLARNQTSGLRSSTLAAQPKPIYSNSLWAWVNCCFLWHFSLCIWKHFLWLVTEAVQEVTGLSQALLFSYHVCYCFPTWPKARHLNSLQHTCHVGRAQNCFSNVVMSAQCNSGLFLLAPGWLWTWVPWSRLCPPLSFTLLLAKVGHPLTTSHTWSSHTQSLQGLFSSF